LTTVKIAGQIGEGRFREYAATGHVDIAAAGLNADKMPINFSTESPAHSVSD
jgi:hypothetical protein